LLCDLLVDLLVDCSRLVRGFLATERRSSSQGSGLEARNWARLWKRFILDEAIGLKCGTDVSSSALLIFSEFKWLLGSRDV
jgi:hypothetical protein